MLALQALFRLWNFVKPRKIQTARKASLDRFLCVLHISLVIILFSSALPSFAQEVLIREIISREISVFTGEAGPTNSYKEVLSREVSVFNGKADVIEMPEIISREVSIVNTTDEFPAQVQNPSITSSPTGEQVTLD